MTKRILKLFMVPFWLIQLIVASYVFIFYALYSYVKSGDVENPIDWFVNTISTKLVL